MKSAYDDVIIFRWNSDRALALKDYARSKGFTLSVYLRLLLDKFVASKGLLLDSSTSIDESRGYLK